MALGAGIFLAHLWGVPGLAADEAMAVREKPVGPTDPKELEAFVDGIVAAQMKDKHIAGATFAFVVDNQPFFAKGYGYADVAARKKVDPATTMFRIGSVSKLLTWTAVMRLVEEGKLDLDADINQYLKDFKIPPTFAEPVTLKHLLTHTPGFEDHVIGLFGRSSDDVSALGPLLARNLPARVRAPGTLASYSNHGTAIAGYIVQEVSGMPWADYIEKTILEPLSMTHTTVRQPATDKLPADLSKGYKYSSGRFVEVPFEYVPPAPAGSASSSAGDMVKFMIAHLRGGELDDVRILREDTARKMHSLAFTHDKRLEGMGYGFMRSRFGDVQIVEHGGDTVAFHSFFVMLPEHKSGFFVSYNTTTAASARNTLLQALLERYYLPPTPPSSKVAADFAARAPRYCGQFGALRHSFTTPAKLGALFGVAHVTAADDQLLVAFNGGELVLRMVELEPGLFREADGQRMLSFSDDDPDQASHMFLGGSPVAWERLPWYATPGFSLALVVACTVVFASVVVGWPLAAFINRGQAPLVKGTAGSKFASWLAWLTSLAALVVIGLAMIPFSDPEQIGFGMPPLLRGLLLSTIALAALVCGVLVCSIVAWARHYWRLSARLHYTLALVAGLTFVWFLYQWNLLGYAA
ncbi:MAG: serine hydrolase [Pirellulales bacterium]